MTTATPRLQIALDTFTLDDAYRALQPAAASVDIIEVGTILCLSEGMRAVRVVGLGEVLDESLRAIREQ